MSVASMVRLVRARQLQDSLPPGGEAETARGGAEAAPAKPDDKAQHAVTTALERLTGFIPGEVVTAWGAAIGILTPSTKARWVIFGVAIAFLVAMLLIETALRDRSADEKEKTPPKRQALMVIVAIVAFTAWAFALPGSPAAEQWGKHVTPYFGVGAIALSALLYKGGQLLGLTPLEDGKKT
ncbi:MAG TPA: hypothetical protein VFL83_14185 [Anaeromyxobacter sp.]|nr:hypothetical protein [Anaeromyxobacter sp.]